MPLTTLPPVSLGKIYITCDFNSRTASSVDYIEFDKYIDQDLSMVLDTCNIPERTNKDRVLNYNGLRLIGLCHTTGMLIANGRLLNDKYIGKFTFCSHIGQSTVDYLLMNFTDFNTLSYFDILEFNEHSDHAPVSFHLLLKPKNAEHNQEIKTESITRKIVWDKSKVEHFKLQLQNKQDSFNQLITEHTDSIDNTVHSFTRLLHDIAFDTFGKTFQTKASHIEHTKTHNAWFDIDCNTARRDFNTARNNFNRVKNDEARRNFTRARTRYNKVKKKAKQKFKIQEGQRISKLAKRDTRKFWKSLRKTFKKKQDEADSLTVHDLHEHFSIRRIRRKRR